MKTIEVSIQIVSDSAATVLTETPTPYRCNEPQRDENGVLILPGYRKPFTSETARKAREVSKKNQLAKLAILRALPKLTQFNSLATDAKISSLKRAHARCLAAAVASTKGSEAMAWMKAATEVLNQLQDLLGHPKSHKSTKKPHLAGGPSHADVRPISPTVSPVQTPNQSANPTNALPASETATDPAIG